MDMKGIDENDRKLTGNDGVGCWGDLNIRFFVKNTILNVVRVQKSEETMHP